MIKKEKLVNTHDHNIKSVFLFMVKEIYCSTVEFMIQGNFYGLQKVLCNLNLANSHCIL